MKPYYHDERAGITIFHGDCREVLPTIAHADVEQLTMKPLDP